MFKFLDYDFNPENFIAIFRYTFTDNDIIFSETVKFAKTENIIDYDLLDRALFLSFILIGTSYYKTHPSREVILEHKIDKYQANFFDKVYQEGLSQFVYENHLKRADLAHFAPNSPDESDPIPLNPADYSGILSLQSGGKDSLLTAELIANTDHSFLYCGNINSHPSILDNLNANCQIITRHLDLEDLQKSGGLNGHVPVTYILASLAIVQAILNHQSSVFLSVGHEGDEPHSYIDDLPVNHQWSKTWEAEQLLKDYVHRYISKDFVIGSPLRQYSELKIAELFVEKCWQKYGHKFSSCNIANYRQGTDNHNLKWCGNCAKCANSYLLFAPFLERTELDSLFDNSSLFENNNLFDDFKGLLGIDNHLKPFECVGEVDELRKAYSMKNKDYPNLPFKVPNSDFDYQKLNTSQDLNYAK